MTWPIIKHDSHHTPDLRRIYLQARQVAFPWVDPSIFNLLDFDQAIQDERVLVATSQRSPIGFIAWWPPDNFIHSLFYRSPFYGKGRRQIAFACLLEGNRTTSHPQMQISQPESATILLFTRLGPDP